MTHAEVYIQAALAANQLASTATLARKLETSQDLIEFGFASLRKAVELADNAANPAF